MSTYLCPKGHNSTESDYCSECGTRIQSNSEPGLSHREQSLPLIDRFEQVICPDCATPHEADSGDFCEICGYNFVTGAHGELPVVVSHPPVADPIKSDAGGSQIQGQESIEPVPPPDSPPPASPAPSTWEVVITIDPIAHDPASPPPPDHVTAFTVRLDKPTSLIGRTSQARAIYPEIPLDFDDAVSHRHALLSLNLDGTLVLRDIGSSNGTILNQVELKPMVDAPLRQGDEITLGHWTRIKVMGRESSDDQ